MSRESADDAPPPRAEIPSDRLRLIELELSESISTRVRGSLFKLYAVIGAVVGAVLTYTGIDLAERINKQASDHTDQLIETTITPKIREAEAQVESAKVQLLVIEELNKNARATIDKVNEQLEDFAPKAQQLERAAAQIEALDTRRKELEASLTVVDQSVTSLSELGTKLSDLAEQVNSLSEVVATLQLNQKTSSDVRSIANAAQALATASQQVTQQVSQINDQTRVFFQFYGMPRDKAQEISQRLRTAGYIVPGEEQIANAAGLSEIRYFWPEDEARAEQVKNDVQSVLSASGVEVKPVSVSSRTNWSKQKPRMGTVELWLGVPAAAQ